MPGPLTQTAEAPLVLKGWSDRMTDPEGPLVRASNAELDKLPQGSDPVSWLKRLQRLTQTADYAASAAFPNSARDSSFKNAYRHSLGTGLLAQQLPGGPQLPVALAKLAGYTWEAPGTAENLKDPAKMTDMRHDLNANSIGAEAAPYFATPRELSLYLLRKALQSRAEAPPIATQFSPGYLTRTVE